MLLIKILFMRFITVFVSHLSHIMSRNKKGKKLSKLQNEFVMLY